MLRFQTLTIRSGIVATSVVFKTVVPVSRFTVAFPATAIVAVFAFLCAPLLLTYTRDSPGLVPASRTRVVLALIQSNIWHIIILCRRDTKHMLAPLQSLSVLVHDTHQNRPPPHVVVATTYTLTLVEMQGMLPGVLVILQHLSRRMQHAQIISRLQVNLLRHFGA